MKAIRFLTAHLRIACLERKKKTLSGVSRLEAERLPSVLPCRSTATSGPIGEAERQTQRKKYLQAHKHPETRPVRCTSPETGADSSSIPVQIRDPAGSCQQDVETVDLRIGLGGIGELGRGCDQSPWRRADSNRGAEM